MSSKSQSRMLSSRSLPASDKESRNNLAILIGKIGFVVTIILGYAKEVDLPITIFLLVCFILLMGGDKPIEKEVTQRIEPRYNFCPVAGGGSGPESPHCTCGNNHNRF
jgi:hypothetical protein